MIDKAITALLPEGRFDEVHALISLEINRNCGIKGTIKGYAKRWGWTPARVRRFIAGVDSSRGVTRIGNRVIKLPVHSISSNTPGVPSTAPPAYPINPLESYDSGERQHPRRTPGVPPVAPYYRDKTETRQNTASDNPERGDTYQSKKGKVLKGAVLEDFQRFWKAFDYRKGKAEAADAFLCAYDPELMEQILAGAREEAEKRQALIDKGGTPKMAQGWLTGRRWEDEQASVRVAKPDCDSCALKGVSHSQCWLEGRTSCEYYQKRGRA